MISSGFSIAIVCGKLSGSLEIITPPPPAWVTHGIVCHFAEGMGNKGSWGPWGKLHPSSTYKVSLRALPSREKEGSSIIHLHPWPALSHQQAWSYFPILHSSPTAIKRFQNICSKIANPACPSGVAASLCGDQREMGNRVRVLHSIFLPSYNLWGSGKCSQKVGWCWSSYNFPKFHPFGNHKSQRSVN